MLIKNELISNASKQAFGRFEWEMDFFPYNFLTDVKLRVINI
jgi:hypothetical protein